MFKHILLPTDGSDLSVRAVDTGIELAAKLGASVHAFHVIAPFPGIIWFAEIIQTDEETYTREATTTAERYLEDVRRRAEAAGVPCQSSYSIDLRPHQAIVAEAERQHCDAIVMASHGWRGVDRLLLGSETNKVLLECSLPVLVCH